MRKPDVDLRAVQRIAGRALPGEVVPSVERAEAGVSTQVYRLRRGGEVFYLRVGEEAAASLAPEVLVHRLLRGRGVRVPQVVHYEPLAEEIGRSVMVTTEVPGHPIGEGEAGVDQAGILAEAGRDLAWINGLRVAGFGWIERHGSEGAPLRAGLPTQRAFALDGLAVAVARLGGVGFAPDEVRDVLGAIARHDAWLDAEEAFLAHGDFDASHVYQLGGRYAGIIDFGEIRGADRFYDLGHFALHDGEALPAGLLPLLLAGYREVVPLPPDYEGRIHFAALLIGVRALARRVGRPWGAAEEHLVAAIRRSLGVLTA